MERQKKPENQTPNERKHATYKAVKNSLRHRQKWIMIASRKKRKSILKL